VDDGRPDRWRKRLVIGSVFLGVLAVVAFFPATANPVMAATAVVAVILAWQ
jgi:hypothetical protein